MCQHWDQFCVAIHVYATRTVQRSSCVSDIRGGVNTGVGFGLQSMCTLPVQYDVSPALVISAGCQHRSRFCIAIPCVSHICMGVSDPYVLYAYDVSPVIVISASVSTSEYISRCDPCVCCAYSTVDFNCRWRPLLIKYRHSDALTFATGTSIWSKLVFDALSLLSVDTPTRHGVQYLYSDLPSLARTGSR